MLDKVQIIYKPVKNITLKVKPNFEIILTVPLDVHQQEIDKILQKRQGWIIQHLNYFKGFNQHHAKELVSGEIFEYLGRNYRLKVTESNDESVKLISGYLHISIRDKADYNKKLMLINSWYKEKAVYYFDRVINKYINLIGKMVDKVSIRKMKTRWGSCNPKKSYINLNLDLIKKHPHAIEYVVFHELVHLIHYHHDKHFHNFLTTHMPDWQIRRKKLY
jgi:predicted metal-dependent hydrolase